MDKKALKGLSKVAKSGKSLAERLSVLFKDLEKAVEAASKEESAPKKAPAKKAPATKKAAAKKSEYQSFQLSEDKDDFMSMKLTRQTLYWTILGVLSVAFAWYTISITQSISDIYTQIDEIRMADDGIIVPTAQDSAQDTAQDTTEE
jgi:hypothetical protein